MRRTRILLPIILVVVALCAGWWVRHGGRSTRRPALAGPVMRAAFLDATRGGGAVIRTPEGELCIIDPGPAAAADGLLRYLQGKAAQAVSVVVTNPSPERSGALKALLGSFQVKRIVRGEMQWPSGELADAIENARVRDIPELVLSAGDGVGLSRRVRLEVLSPPRGLLPDVDRGSASNSLVVRVRYGTKRILLASDAGIEAEGWLIRTKADLRSDVLEIARRGKRGATSLELVSFVRPRVFVVSAGGRFGRPSRAVLARISPENTAAAVYRTDRDGTIEVVTNGRTIAVETERGGRE